MGVGAILTSHTQLIWYSDIAVFLEYLLIASFFING